jgi:DNA mismatch endonuclease (patch repair protein)
MNRCSIDDARLTLATLCQHMRNSSAIAPNSASGIMTDSRDRYQPWATSPAVRQVMRGNRKRDTRPELLLRRALHALGLRYRVASRPLPDRPWTADIVFLRAKIAVFVDGCYWHGCPDHYSPPRTNAGYWGPKIERNRQRDTLVDAELQAAGWTCVRIWEHEANEVAVAAVFAAVRATACGP